MNWAGDQVHYAIAVAPWAGRAAFKLACVSESAIQTAEHRRTVAAELRRCQSALLAL
jgi:hypothetical protein